MIDWMDRNDPEVAVRLSRECELCKAVPGQLCTNQPISDHRLLNRLVHHGR